MIPTLEGFYYYFLRKATGKQVKYFRYALARLKREHPQADPRRVLVEFFAHWCYLYEEELRLEDETKERRSRERVPGPDEQSDSTGPEESGY